MLIPPPFLTFCPLIFNNVERTRPLLALVSQNYRAVHTRTRANAQARTLTQMRYLSPWGRKRNKNCGTQHTPSHLNPVLGRSVRSDPEGTYSLAVVINFIRFSSGWVPVRLPSLFPTFRSPLSRINATNYLQSFKTIIGRNIGFARAPRCPADLHSCPLN